jgi:hypothetical protein
MSAEIRGIVPLRSWLIVLALLPGAVRAQAHGPPATAAEPPAMDPAEVAAVHQAKLAELDVWLRRLVGQFKYEGIKDPGLESARGTGNCIGVGTGPGVQCMIYLSWPSTHGDPGLATHEPAMVLYGMDTNEAGIRSLQVNSKGIPEGALGFLKGDMAVFKLPRCVNESVARPPCRRFIRIEAKAGGRFIYMWDDTEHLKELPGRGLDWVRVGGLMLSMERLAEAEVARETEATPEPVATP